MQLDEIANVTRKTNGDYEILFHPDFKGEIASGVSEDKIDWQSEIKKPLNQNSICIKCPYPEQRLVFAINDTRINRILYVSERHIPLEGTANFRDLGGITNKQGQQVRWGTIFRSGGLANLTTIDLAYFKTLAIGTVIDFRTHDEVLRNPDRYPDTGVESIHAMIGNPADMKAALNNQDISQITAQQANMYMLGAYKHFIEALTDFQPVFDTLLKNKAEKPFLFHCTAGKDRTGIAAALVLSTLNVSREVIINDYLLSNVYNVAFFEANKQKLMAYGFTEDVIRVLSYVKHEYLSTLFHAIDTTYGSSEKMLEQVFGIDDKKQQLLIDQYTI